VVVVTVVVVIVLPQPASECGGCTRFSLGADHSMYASLGRCWRGLSASVGVDVMWVLVFVCVTRLNLTV